MRALAPPPSIGYDPPMSKKPSRPRDANRLAKMIVDIATGEEDDTVEEPSTDPRMSELGRKGGEKGGPARAATLTPEERSEIAKKAAEARWGKGE